MIYLDNAAAPEQRLRLGDSGRRGRPGRHVGSVAGHGRPVVDERELNDECNKDQEQRHHEREALEVRYVK